MVHWARGGKTSLENVCSLCRRHHTYVHEGGFTIEGDGITGFTIRRPNGEPVTPGGRLPELSARRQVRPDSLLALHEALDMAFHAGSFICDWDGEHPD